MKVTCYDSVLVLPAKRVGFAVYRCLLIALSIVGLSDSIDCFNCFAWVQRHFACAGMAASSA